MHLRDMLKEQESSPLAYNGMHAVADSWSILPKNNGSAEQTGSE